MRARTALILGVFVAVGSGAPAHADWLLTPYGGLVFGGDLSEGTGGDVDGSSEHGVYGLSFGYMGDSALGFEIDLGYSPDFFGGDDTIVPDNNLVTLMGNLVLNAPFGESSTRSMS